MRHPVLVLLTSAVMLPALGTGSALADVPAVQSADQSASTTQSASSSANAVQVKPTNSVVDIRIGSDGSNGAVEQSNTNSASSSAGNAAETAQSSGQSSGGSGVQETTQGAATAQKALSQAGAVQIDPANDVVRIRIHSNGDDGPVTQSNDNSASSQAGNKAQTTQSAGQSSGGGGGVQDAEQAAKTGQAAESDATATQKHPSNEVVRIRIHSDGANGDVKQSNSNTAGSSAGNSASTVQGAEQSQAGGGTQSAGQVAKTGQSAASSADAVQDHPSNSVESIRLHSPGDDGAIEQSNTNSASSSAGNKAGTTQTVSQLGGSGGVQASDQLAFTGQSAGSEATAYQSHPSNEAGGVRIHSAGSGGTVTQTNANAASSQAGNSAATTQDVLQALGGKVVPKMSTDGCCEGKGDGKAVQAAGQSAKTWQSAESSADASQVGALNKAGGVRVGSFGDDGSVEQANANAAHSSAGNKAGTTQTLQQVIGGFAGKLGVQAAGQDAFTGQVAKSAAIAEQVAPCNLFAPVTLAAKTAGEGKGGFADPAQANANDSGSSAGSAGATLQRAGQML